MGSLFGFYLCVWHILKGTKCIEQRDRYNHLRGAMQTDKPDLTSFTFNVMECRVEYSGYIAPMHLNNLIDGYIVIVYLTIQVEIITGLV